MNSTKHRSKDLFTLSMAVTCFALMPEAGTVLKFTPDQTATTYAIDEVIARKNGAYCNDGTLPSISYQLAPTPSRKWIVDLHGGGSCKSDEDCLGRWNDFQGSKDLDGDGYPHTGKGNQATGGYTAMTGDYALPGDYMGAGMLDFEGISIEVNGVTQPQAPSQKSPFKDDGFNRVMVHYCSSDQYTGTGAMLNVAQPASGEGFPQLNGSQSKMVGAVGKYPALVDANTKANLYFAGAKIIDAVFETILTGALPGMNGIAGEWTPDNSPATEIVFAGSSGGGGGVAQNIDRVKDYLLKRGFSESIYWGIIDAIGTVTDNITTSDKAYDVPHRYWSGLDQPTGKKSLNIQDSSCLVDAAGIRECELISNLLKYHISTPYFYSINDYDPTVHQFAYYSLLIQNLFTKYPVCAAMLPTPTQNELLGFLVQSDWEKKLLSMVQNKCSVYQANWPNFLADWETTQNSTRDSLRVLTTHGVDFIGQGVPDLIPNGIKKVGYYVPNYFAMHQIAPPGGCGAARFFNSDSVYHLDPNFFENGVGGQKSVNQNLMKNNITDNLSMSLAVQCFRDRVVKGVVSSCSYQVRNDAF